MPIRQNEKYELPAGKTEQDTFANKLGVKIKEYATENEFHSNNITVGGKKFKRFDRERIKNRLELHKEISEEIPGLSCPDCHAQAFKTDQKQVAVCGDYPGWYFFYRRLEEEKTPERKTKFIIKNGQIVEAEEETMETEKQV